METSEPADTPEAQLSRIERLLVEIKQLAEEREDRREQREERRYDQVRPLIGPALELEQFLIQMHEIFRKQAQALQEQADAVQQLLTVTRRSERDATEQAEHAREIGG